MTLKQFLRDTCWPTLATIIGVALLLGLGTWQMQRLLWKEALLEEVTTKFSKPVEDIDRLLGQPMQQIMKAEYQRIKVAGTFLHDQEMKWMSRIHNGKVGIHIVTPLLLTSGSMILVDRGWTPAKEQNKIIRPQEIQTIVGFLRTSHKPVWLTPRNNISKGELYSIDLSEIAREKSLLTLLPFYIAEEAHPESSTFPKPVGLTLNLQNHHLQYAITWYTLALVLVVLYILYIRKKF